MRFWPASLGGRTALVLLVGLVLVQVAGLTIHAFDRVDALRLAQIHNVAVRAISIYRSVAVAPVASRAAVVHEIHVRDGIMVRLQEAPPASALPPSRRSCRS